MKSRRKKSLSLARRLGRGIFITRSPHRYVRGERASERTTTGEQVQRSLARATYRRRDPRAPPFRASFVSTPHLVPPSLLSVLAQLSLSLLFAAFFSRVAVDFYGAGDPAFGEMREVHNSQLDVLVERKIFFAL